jgi:proteic killer suppression protein
MIRSFRSKELREFAKSGDSSKLGMQEVARLERLLARLEAARVPSDMSLPGYRCSGLSGRMADRYAVEVPGGWRITFGWDRNDAVDVDLEDNH